jgi:hypothetical protein
VEGTLDRMLGQIATLSLASSTCSASIRARPGVDHRQVLAGNALRRSTLTDPPCCPKLAPIGFDAVHASTPPVLWEARNA